MYKYNTFFLNIYIYAFIFYLYIHKKYAQYTHICYVKKNILDVINRLTALI